ncbi:MAG: FCD domain-containing protein [Alphaproteobacteria bacterium]|nr:FCD domain-containing protein [Alphaproteobacteria bacterium]
MGRKSSDVIVDLRAMLEDIPIGERLPTERDLARDLSCSRETVRLCLASLEKDREVWRHVGQGTFRGPRPRHLPMRDNVLVEGASPEDVMRARLLLEPQVAAEAARNADAADVALLRRRVAEGRAARDRPACEQADDAFHNALAAVSRNPILTGFLNYLSGIRRRSGWQREWDRTYRRIGAGEFLTVHSDQHERVVDAIAARKPEDAFAAMQGHLETIQQSMQGKE